MAVGNLEVMSRDDSAKKGNSYLVDVEFKYGLLGCEKTMLRGPPGLVPMRTVVWQVLLPQLVWMRTVVWQVFLLRLLWIREEQLQIQQLNCRVVRLWSRISWLTFPLLRCVVHALLEGAEKLHLRREAPPCRHGGGEEITVITPVVSLDYFSLGLTDNTTGEGNTPTLVLCDSNTTYSPGLMAPRNVLFHMQSARRCLKSDDVPLITVLVTAV